MTFDEVSRIVSMLDGSSCDELVVETGDTKLVIRRRGAGAGAAPAPTAAAPMAAAPAAESRAAAPAARPAAAPPAAAGARSDGVVEVCAPMVGTFYSTPSPTEPPFVEVGGRVEKGQPLCLIEVMKLFTTLYAEQSGRVTRVLPANGELVQHGQPLFLIEPA
ncbi:acetyl-CoA carboxylase biotin carboxyl carrier protein [Azospirillum oleiclasticum]|uniref:acetyl-CoA carboxylase biotin carboxyl carrier protein n=1 Tax=Azospirillum oleiclasticum TaxID=2735135 RepID=UPI001B3BB11E|nr:acetyl-CoA carboxylase biotin carboxyl carrier protein [Azospirillum oleiclasticum]